MKFKVKTKEVKPKLYSIVYLNKQTKTQVLRVILAYSFEDAVEVGRQALIQILGITLAESLAYEPTLYQSIQVDSILEFVEDGTEKVVTDTNAIMNKIASIKDPKKAKELLTQHKYMLSKEGVKYLEDEIKKKE